MYINYYLQHINYYVHILIPTVDVISTLSISCNSKKHKNKTHTIINISLAYIFLHSILLYSIYICKGEMAEAVDVSSPLPFDASE